MLRLPAAGVAAGTRTARNIELPPHSNTKWSGAEAPTRRGLATAMNDASSTQGWAICLGAAALAMLFLIGVANGSYLALAIPVAVFTLFVLGLAGWVGYTIATVRVEAALDPPPQADSTPGADAGDEASER